MKKLSYILPLFVFAPVVALASNTTATFGDGLSGFLISIISFINNFVVPFVLAIAFLAFIWGIVSTFVLGGQDEEKQKKGRQLMLYAIIAFVVILAFWGIVNLLTQATGLGGDSLQSGQIIVPGTPTGTE